MVMNCLWTWDGTMWTLTQNNCGCCAACPVPTTPGTMIGQETTTNCQTIPPPYCLWTWNGTMWVLENNPCPYPSSCEVPPGDGTFEGQTVITQCIF